MMENSYKSNLIWTLLVFFKVQMKFHGHFIKPIILYVINPQQECVGSSSLIPKYCITMTL